LIVVGHSFGGQVALELALLAPQRVRRLIIVCSRHTPFPAFARRARAVSSGEPVDIDAGMRHWFTPRELATDGAAVRYARRRVASASNHCSGFPVSGLTSSPRKPSSGHARWFVGGYAAIRVRSRLRSLRLKRQSNGRAALL
jgi:pimeloyl-ACP methyl ester carboxylesterase